MKGKGLTGDLSLHMMEYKSYHCIGVYISANQVGKGYVTCQKNFLNSWRENRLQMGGIQSWDSFKVSLWTS